MAKLLKDLPINGKVKFGKHQVNSETPEPIIWKIVAKNHQCEPAYPENSVTLNADKMLDLRAADACEVNNPVHPYNLYGSNRYRLSNIHQWLNSNASHGEWYSPQHEYDYPPDTSEVVDGRDTQYYQRPGFLYYFSAKEIEKILTTTIRVALNTVFDGGGYEDFQTKLFLPSNTEIQGYDERGIYEGAKWEEAYPDKNSRIVEITRQCCNNTNFNGSFEINYFLWSYVLRTPISSSPMAFCGISHGGNNETIIAKDGQVGILPALNLPDTLPVTDEPDEDGAYVVILDSPPDIISDPDGNLGSLTIPVKKAYTLSDSDGNYVNVVEKLDGEQIRTLANQKSGTVLEYDLSERWQELSYDEQHTAVIEVSNKFMSSVRTWTFTKIPLNTISRHADSFAAPMMPTSVKIGSLTNATSAPAIQVLVTNNAFDDEPVWEDATESYISGNDYVFKNKTKTASSWGVAAQYMLTNHPAALDVSVKSEINF